MDKEDIKKIKNYWLAIYPESYVDALFDAGLIDKKSFEPIPAVPMEIEKPIPIHSRFDILDL